MVKNEGSEEYPVYVPIDRCSIEQEASDENQLKTVFENGKIVREFSLSEIRNTRKSCVQHVVTKNLNN